jgi:hypothetical protein
MENEVAKIRDVDVHGLVGLSVSILLVESRSDTLDLDAGLCFTLDIFNECSLQ